MSAHDDIKTHFDSYLMENEKFDKGNSAAGTRARKALAEMANQLKHAVMKLLLKKPHEKKRKPNLCINTCATQRLHNVKTKHSQRRVIYEL